LGFVFTRQIGADSWLCAASPAGTTIEAIAALESGNMRSTVINAVRAAAARSKALGER